MSGMVSYSGYKLVADLQSERHGILLTGGAVIEVLSGGLFETRDWDAVPSVEGDVEKISDALRERGYVKLGETWYKKTEEGHLKNPGEFIKSKYPWGKTLTVEVGPLELETVALEWIFVDRISKCRRGQRKFCEQALFLNRYVSEGEYTWDEELIETIADHRDVPPRFLEEEWIEERAGYRGEKTDETQDEKESE